MWRYIMWRYCGLVLFLAFASTANRSLSSPPRNVQIVKCGERRAEVTWRRPKHPGKVVILYKVQYSTTDNPSQWFDAQTVGAQQKRASIQLPANSIVRLRVSAHNGVGWSEPGSPGRECNVTAARPDRNPSDVIGMGTTESNMVISWESMPLVDHNGPGFQYFVKWRRHSNQEKWQSAKVPYPLNSYVVRGLETYSKYDITVQSLNALGPAVIVPGRHIGFSGEGVPTEAPKKFQLGPDLDSKAVDYKLLRFLWLSVSEAVETIRGEFKGYRIFLEDINTQKMRQEDILMLRRTEPSTSPSLVAAVVRDLIPNTSYKAHVAVLNNRYSGPPSNTIFFTTSEGAPGPVEKLDVIQMSNTSIRLVWRPPRRTHGNLTGYQYTYRRLTGAFSLGPIITGPRLPPNSYHTTIMDLHLTGKYRIYLYAFSKGGRGDPRFIETNLRALKWEKKFQQDPKSSTPYPQLTILEPNDEDMSLKQVNTASNVKNIKTSYIIPVVTILWLISKWIT